jgi:chromosome segregation ATPase
MFLITNRKYKRTLKELMVGRDALPPVATTKSVIAHEVELMHEEARKTQDVIAELKKDVDVYMNTYLKEETRGKDKGIFYQASYAEVAELEQEVVQLRKEERVRERTVVEIASQRERASRLAAMKLKRLKETLEVKRVKELIIVDLKKQRREAGLRLRDFQQLYDLVKNQRNKFVNLIQASSQSIAEMKEKLKILLNEVEILRGEIVSKEKLLAKAQIDHSAAVVDRNHLQAEMNKGSVVFRDKQTLVDEQISEMDKLNAVINGYEKEMLRHKKQYETQVELRNHAGITLIDRNDELCILYEKANIQELVCKQGDVAVASRADEIRLLRLEMQEVMRSVGVTRKMLPQIPCLDQDIMQLQEQLLHVRAQSAELSEALESPENKLRWRRLEGKIPSKEELVAKVTQLEERLNDKKEQLLEKELVLEEVSSLADRLRQQAAEGRSDTLELAKKVNDYQQKIRGITRKMMATVSELSMYQASSLKLQSEKHGLTAELEDAQISLESGEPPTLDAEREWFRMERDRLGLLELRERLAEEAAEDVGGAGGDVKTTAEPRPNAYIPEDLGIPKPYSTYAPFKPTEPGSTMRFIRKPVPREIVI